MALAAGCLEEVEMAEDSQNSHKTATDSSLAVEMEQF